MQNLQNWTWAQGLILVAESAVASSCSFLRITPSVNSENIPVLYSYQNFQRTTGSGFWNTILENIGTAGSYQLKEIVQNQITGSLGYFNNLKRNCDFRERTNEELLEPGLEPEPEREPEPGGICFSKIKRVKEPANTGINAPGP